MTRTPTARCPDQLALFVTINSQRSGRKPANAAIADLDKHEAIAIQHDQVEFAITAAVVALYDGQSV